jgi:Fe-S cluster assembly ATPase SufC
MWEICVEIDESEYIWSGALEEDGFQGDVSENPFLHENERMKGHEQPAFENEELKKDGSVIFSRSRDIGLFKGDPEGSVPPQKSFVRYFSDDGDVKSFIEGFKNILFIGSSLNRNLKISREMHHSFETGTADLKEISVSDLPDIYKLAYVYIKEKELFDEIAFKFKDVFPYVEKIAFFENEAEKNYQLCIKEENTGWICQGHLSSGMFKTLMFMTQMSILSGRCVVLMDEVENSLGLNCIDILWDELKRFDRDDQFLITTHHSYVINNVEPKYWKVITREAGVVTVKDAHDLKIGMSHHDAFMQLINTPEYNRGITK